MTEIAEVEGRMCLFEGRSNLCNVSLSFQSSRKIAYEKQNSQKNRLHLQEVFNSDLLMVCNWYCWNHGIAILGTTFQSAISPIKCPGLGVDIFTVSRGMIYLCVCQLSENRHDFYILFQPKQRVSACICLHFFSPNNGA